MKNLLFVFLLPLFFTSCDKSISYGGRSLWQKKEQQNKDYNKDVFVNQQQANYSNQAGNTGNNQQYSNNMNGYNNYDSYENKNLDRNGNNSINIYVQNPQNQKDTYSNNVDRGNRDLINNLEQSMNNNAKNSALFDGEQKSGQIELSSKGQFQQNNEQKKVKYAVSQQENVNYDDNKKSIKENEIVAKLKQETKKKMQNVHKSYKIQCGYYTSENYANSVVDLLENSGIDDVNILYENGKYRILVGDFQSKEEGMNLFNKIKKLDLNDNIFWTYR